MKSRLSLALAASLSAMVAMAEDAPKSPPTPATAPTPSADKSTKTKGTAKKGDVKYKKNVAMEFEGRSVDGNVVSPDSADVEGDKNIKFDSLLDGRKDFKREFKRSSGVSK